MVHRYCSPGRFKAVINIDSVCVYCGMDAQTKDHFLSFNKIGSPYYLPSCTSCNIALSDLLVSTMHDRLMCLSRKLHYKYRKVLPCDYDIVTMKHQIKNGNLPQQFKGKKGLKEAAQFRLAWIDLAQDIIGDINLYDLPYDTMLKSRITEFIYANK